MGLSALATALLGAWAVRRGLRPLRRMGEVAAGVSARSLTTRLPQAQMPPELAQLAGTMNAMLERLDDAFQRLSAFSADIAHELRTPLSNLLTHTQVTLTRPRSLEEYREALHGNLEELQWMAQLVNDMLYLAKADHGLLMPNREPLALDQEADALIEYYAPLAEDAQISLSREGLAELTGDRNMLRRALSNLLDNALRFTPAQGEIRVEIAQGDGRVRLVVANRGAPIDAALLPRLFDRFYRADPARREGSSEHAGLGLAITRSIVQAHGGVISAESAQGWTRFLIDLPGTQRSPVGAGVAGESAHAACLNMARQCVRFAGNAGSYKSGGITRTARRTPARPAKHATPDTGWPESSSPTPPCRSAPHRPIAVPMAAY